MKLGLHSPSQVNDGKAFSIDEVIDHGAAQANLCCHLRDGEQQGLGCQFISLLHDGYQFLCLAANQRFKPNREIRCLEQLYPPLPSHGVMFWPISSVTLTEFFLVTCAAEAPSSVTADAVDVT
jgi:hypothetical protein